MSVEKLITDHIDIWSSALQTRSTAGRGSNGKIDLYGIKKLRELILELAVRGKLVAQDPNDEPASELLKRIAAEKAELVKQGKIKKQKPLPEISEDEKPFELPGGWEWVRLGQLVEILDHQRKPVTKEARSSGEYPYYGASGIVDYIDDYIFDDELVLVGEDGAKWNKGDKTAFCISGKAWVNNHAHVIKPFNSVLLNEFVSCYLTATDLSEYITGTTVPKLNQAKLVSIPVPLSSLNTQFNICSKVNELMQLCDELEQQSLTSLNANQQLVETLLGTLTDSQNAEELAENWARISQHFDTLFTTETSIDTLKQTILQLAVMGKLVPQDPNDEPASELLKRIEQEKAQLVKEGKIKKQKPLPPVSDEEKPFELPQGWEWCRLGHCIHLISGQHLKPNEYSESIVEGAIPYITGPAEFGDSNPTYSKFTLEKRAVAKPKDILITCKGAGLGKLNVANVEIAISRQLMSIRAISTSFDYFKLLLSSMYNYFQGKGIGIAIPGISREDVTEPVILLPPLNEQERIVLNVNSLFGLCDTLKSRLQSAQQTQLHLADALTDAALN
ncbi:restriction endonuclease subunit S [Serratia nevei]|uniref:restriction endonuclease subunit S n=1 Tax=Serratia nevei TaxID=2703794 RepID=UPI00313C3A77|nr:type I restriction endonuclease EcoAI subunit S [Serratia marcescens]